jgi:hypothetical protein
MTTIRDLIILYYQQNPNTEEKAIDIANRFNYRPELSHEKRAKSVRDLKRVAVGNRNLKQVITPKNTSYRDSSYKENLDKGTLEVSSILTTEPRSPQEIIDLHKVDESIWKLSQYWSKEKSSGWQVSAMFVQKNTEELTHEDLLEGLSKTLVTDNIVPYVVVKKESNKKALFVYLSDKHIGAMTKPDAMYDNVYNRAVFRKRLAEVYTKILETVELVGTFEDIYICDLGDSMDGWNGYTTRGGHKLPQNMDNKEAFNTYVFEHKIFFDNLIRSGFGNHYHAIMQTNDNHSSDYGYIANQALSLYLETAYPGIEIRLMTKFLEHINYGLHTIILTHGKDSEDLKHGLPLQLTPKAENFLEKYISYHKIDTEYPIHVIKGDLHSESQQVAYHFRYRNVLSMYGASKWIMNNFGPSHAGVSFDIYNKNSKGVYSFYHLFN